MMDPFYDHKMRFALPSYPTCRIGSSGGGTDKPKYVIILPSSASVLTVAVDVNDVSKTATVPHENGVRLFTT